MRTFDMSATMQFSVVVPDEFVLNMRLAAQGDDVSEFLQHVQSMYPNIEDDDEFILMVLRNGIRKHIRQSVVTLLEESKLGGTFSPVQLKDRGPGVAAVLSNEVQELIPA